MFVVSYDVTSSPTRKLSVDTTSHKWHMPESWTSSSWHYPLSHMAHNWFSFNEDIQRHPGDKSGVWQRERGWDKMDYLQKKIKNLKRQHWYYSEFNETCTIRYHLTSRLSSTARLHMSLFPLYHIKNHNFFSTSLPFWQTTFLHHESLMLY